MLKAINENLSKVTIAYESEKNSNYSCLFCKQGVLLKKGNVKIHHFAHKDKLNCPYDRESLEHLKAKLEIRDKLIDLGIDADVEVQIGSRFADVLFEIDDNKIALEIQRSNLSKEELLLRTKNYYDNNVYVLWFIINDDFYKNIKTYSYTDIYGLDSEYKAYNLPDWQNNISQLYFKEIYVYLGDLLFDVFKLTKKTVERDYDYYDESGNNYYGTKSNVFKKRHDYKKVSSSLNLLSDFNNSNLKNFHSIPSRKVYVKKFQNK
jgi:competence protein CoiA